MHLLEFLRLEMSRFIVMFTYSKIKGNLCIQVCTDPMIDDKVSSLSHVIMMQGIQFAERYCLSAIYLAYFIEYCVQHCLSTGSLKCKLSIISGKHLKISCRIC